MPQRQDLRVFPQNVSAQVPHGEAGRRHGGPALPSSLRRRSFYEGCQGFPQWKENRNQGKARKGKIFDFMVKSLV